MDNEADQEAKFLAGMICRMRDEDPYVFAKSAINGADVFIADAQEYGVDDELVQQLIDSRASLLKRVERGDPPEDLHWAEVRTLSMRVFHLLLEVPDSPYVELRYVDDES